MPSIFRLSLSLRHTGSVSFSLHSKSSISLFSDTCCCPGLEQGHCWGVLHSDPAINQEQFHPLLLFERHLQSKPSKARLELGDFCHTAQGEINAAGCWSSLSSLERVEPQTWKLQLFWHHFSFQLNCSQSTVASCRYYRSLKISFKIKFHSKHKTFVCQHTHSSAIQLGDSTTFAFLIL